jgi:hypothetical protein
MLSSVELTNEERVLALLREAKRLANEYRQLTGKPLGITGEVAGYEAAQILGVELTPARNSGYDAIEVVDGVTRRHQIKGRCLLNENRDSESGGSTSRRSGMPCSSSC